MKNALKKGDFAPRIHAKDIWGTEISVPKNDKWLYVSFHRFAACPFCNLRTNELIRNYPRFKEKNIEIISIWPSEKKNLLRFAGQEQTPFPMVSDASKRSYSDYGVSESSLVGAVKLLFHPSIMYQAMRNIRKKIEDDKDPKLLPASFLIDTKGIIQLAHYGKHYGDHPDIKELLEWGD